MNWERLKISLELLAFRVRMMAWRMVQLAGFGLFFYGAWGVIEKGLVVQQSLWIARPELEAAYSQAITTDVIFIGVGAAIVWLATR